MDQWYVMKPETNKIKDHLKLLPLTEKVESESEQTRKRPAKDCLCHLVKSALDRRAVYSLFWRTKESIHQNFFHSQISLCEVKRLLWEVKDRFIRIPAITFFSETCLIVFWTRKFNKKSIELVINSKRRNSRGINLQRINVFLNLCDSFCFLTFKY